MNAFCEKCGTSLSPGALFCRSCGQKVGEAINPNTQPEYAQPQYTQPQYAPQPQYVQPEYAQPQYAPTPKSKKMLIIVIAAVLLIAAVAIALLFVMGGTPIEAKYVSGSWDCYMTLQVVNDGAELFGINKSSIDVDKDIWLDISLDDSGEGRLRLTPYVCEAHYKGGVLTADQSLDGGAKFFIEGRPSDEGYTYFLYGTWKITDGSDKVLASGTWSASKE